MKNNSTGLGRHTAIYGIGNVVSAAASFLLIPLYTRLFPTNEYGILELANRTADIIILVMMMGLRQAFIRFFLERDDITWRKQVTGTTFLFIIATSIIGCGILLTFHGYFSKVLFMHEGYDLLFTAMVIWIPFEMLANIGLAYLQVQMYSISFVCVTVFKLVAIISLNLLLIYKFNTGIISLMIANAVVAFTISLVFIIYFIHWTKFGFKLEVLLSLIKFGLPFLPAAFFMFIINNSDRYFLSRYSSLSAVGIYSLAFKIGMFGGLLVVDPFLKVWSPFVYKYYKQESGSLHIAKFFHYFMVLIAATGVAISVTAPIILPIISNDAYFSAYKIIPIICLSTIFNGLAQLADTGILIKKKTFLKPFIFGFGAVVSVVCNFVLISKFNELGAGITLCITTIALFLTNLAVSQKYYYFPVSLKNIALTTLFYCVTCISAVLFFSTFQSTPLKYLTPIFFIVFVILMVASSILPLSYLLVFLTNILNKFKPLYTNKSSN